MVHLSGSQMDLKCPKVKLIFSTLIHLNKPFISRMEQYYDYSGAEEKIASFVYKMHRNL
jgi:hypothetical protein